MDRRSRLAALAVPVVAVTVLAGLLLVLAGKPGLVGDLDPSPKVTPAPALPPTPTPPPQPTPSPSPTPPGADPLLGTDGRLTMLLLGSDYRPAHPGNRTDAIMVVSVDPSTRRTAAFSIPRDAVDFPLPESGTYGPKVNSLYQYLESETGDGGRAMKAAVGRAFGIEVDGYVLLGFAGVKRLVDAIGGVDVVLDRAYYDPYYSVSRTVTGWGLPAGKSHLDGDDALILARSRKGDNDFGRARRQQLLLMAVLDRVRSRGVAGLPRLLAIAASTARTDLPLERAPELYTVLMRADSARAQRVVFGPRTYATGRAPGEFALRLDVCRAWIERHFPPPRPFGSWSPDLSPTTTALPSP